MIGHAQIDTNANGMSDVWERHFNNGNLFDPANPAHAPGADPDGDTWTNLQEFIAGTDPFSGSPPEGMVATQVTYLEGQTEPPSPEFPDGRLIDLAIISWETLPGKQYNLLFSPDLTSESWLSASAPITGDGQIAALSITLTDLGGETPERLFWRVNIEDPQIDGDDDDLTEYEEYLLGSNSFAADTSGDGIPDGWLAAHGLNPNHDHSDILFPGSDITVVAAYNMGVHADPDATPEDLDGDGVPNELDADPRERAIDWAPAGHPAFAVIELDIGDIDDWSLDDFTANGTILLTRSEDHAPVGRAVIDRNQVVHYFPHGDNPSTAAPFVGWGGTLRGEQVMGFSAESGASLWDPLTNTFTAWQRPFVYEDDIEDERDGIFVARNWLNLPPNSPDGLRQSPNGALLPGEDDVQSNACQIEENGNMVSDIRYWRKDPATGDLGAPQLLPGTPSAVRSATLAQGSPAVEWHLVAANSGLMVAKDGGAFVQASGALKNVPVHGVTKQGWVVDTDQNRIRTNGEWHALANILGSENYEEADLLDIMDTGLAIAKTRRPGQPFRLSILLPVEIAPEVLAVNSDFDEGRIDPATGYAIPDCDDIPGVDPKTGAGNTLMALEAVRPHLDGTYAQNQRVTNNLHKGWFGVNPKTLGDDFWDGANVTIRKIDKIDDDTGHPESGQVRFYAKWGEGPSQYRGIPAYDPATLAPANLVTGGINGVPSESVYGSNSIIPENAEFYMEGIRPGRGFFPVKMLKFIGAG